MIPYYLGEVAAVKSLCEQLQPYTTGGTSGEGIQAFIDQTKKCRGSRRKTVTDCGQWTDK